MVKVRIGDSVAEQHLAWLAARHGQVVRSRQLAPIVRPARLLIEHFRRATILPPTFWSRAAYSWLCRLDQVLTAGQARSGPAWNRHASTCFNHPFHSLREYAASLGYSYGHLGRKLKRHWNNTNPGRAIRYFRINSALRLLATMQKPISAIARLCGYRSTTGFILAFKRAIKTTPGRYRRNQIRAV